MIEILKNWGALAVSLALALSWLAKQYWDYRTAKRESRGEIKGAAELLDKLPPESKEAKKISAWIRERIDKEYHVAAVPVAATSAPTTGSQPATGAPNYGALIAKGFEFETPLFGRLCPEGYVPTGFSGFVRHGGVLWRCYLVVAISFNLVCVFYYSLISHEALSSLNSGNALCGIVFIHAFGYYLDKARRLTIVALMYRITLAATQYVLTTGAPGNAISEFIRKNIDDIRDILAKPSP